ELVDSDSEKSLIRSEASGLLRNMNKLETAFMISLWCDILQKCNNVNKFEENVPQFETKNRKRKKQIEESNEPDTLKEYSPSEIRKSAKMLRTIYNQDLDEPFDNECIHFQSLLKTLNDPPTNLLQMILNCSTERSFSVLQRIKNYLRSTMLSDRLNSLAILAIELSITCKLDFSEIIKTFAKKQCKSSYNDIDKLILHFKNAHNLNSRSPVRCNDCGRMFTLWSRFKRHVIRHHNFNNQNDLINDNVNLHDSMNSFGPLPVDINIPITPTTIIDDFDVKDEIEVQKHVNQYIINPLLDAFINFAKSNFQSERPSLYNDFSSLVSNLRNPFKLFNSDYKLYSFLKNDGYATNFKEVTINDQLMPAYRSGKLQNKQITIKEENYQLNVSDPNSKGVDNESLLNHIPSFYVVKNYYADIMHDLFEG
ncbi:52 kDa repressor of the inhibitor of the protein kinase-like, partial [Aphis craccivora]